MKLSSIWNVFKRIGKLPLRQYKAALPILLVAGTLATLVAIWWFGPGWNWHGHAPLASLWVRIVATLLVLMIASLLGSLMAARREKQRAGAATNPGEGVETPHLRYVRAQERALDQSLAALRGNLKGRNGIYELPWYLVLGQENTGKTSFINRSNQKFSLTGELKAGSRRAFQDPDLAYSIDWWMGDEAVLIDPPGELISQSDDATIEPGPAVSEGTGAAEAAPAPATPAAAAPRRSGLPAGTHGRLWESLIDWLARNRSRRPLNGVVLMVDMVTLLNQKASDRKALSILLRTRLSELSQRLGTRPPLYVVLSKFDLLTGFEPFFARLPRSVREDIFGFTFTLDSVTDYDAWLAELAERYDGLIKRLNERLFDALSQSNSVEAREALFSLVRQLAGMRPVLLSFLADILGSDRYTTPALPRGVYFSSVYQQGLLCNAFINTASQSYGVSEPVADVQPSGRSVVYFAQQLFQRIIYPEAGLGGDNLKVLAAKRRDLTIGFGAAALGGLVIVGCWYHYYGVNREKVTQVLDKSQEFSARQIDGSADPTGRNLLEPLDQIRSAVAVFGDYRNAWPFVADLGLYQGRRIGPKVDEAYLQLLSTRFLPALASGLMVAIDAAPAGSAEQLSALRVYRMIEDRANRRAPIVEAWMGRQWHSAFPGDGAVQGGLMRHLTYALKYAEVDLPQYRRRVAQLQQHLRQVPMPERVYMTMSEQAGKALLMPLDLRNEIGPAFDIVYQPADARRPAAAAATRIEALLTAKGFRDFFDPRSGDFTELAMIDQWTLGERSAIDYSEADKQALAEKVRALYNRDYIDTWQRVLNGLEVVDFDDIGQAASVLAAVTSPGAPLRRLVETVRDNTALHSAATLPAGAAGGVISAAPSVAPLNIGKEQQVAAIARPFAPLTGLLTTAEGKPSYLDESMTAIARVHDVVRSVQDSAEPGKAALAVVLDRFALKGTDPIGNLQRMAAGMPEPLNRQVGKLADESSQVLLIEALKELERRWDTEVYRYYSERLANRYPFNPAARADASLEDFTFLFGPQGRLAQFQEQYLKPFLKDNMEALYSARRGGYLVRGDVLKQLEAVDRIRDAFFNSRGALGVQFNVEPLALASTRRSSVLSIEGQLISYSHGATSSIGLIWPNSLGADAESRITLVSASGTTSSLVHRGSWSMFRLLSQARLDSATANAIELSFAASDGAMRYRLTAEKANNPFTHALFAGFTLPRSLLADMPVKPKAARALAQPARKK